MENVPTYLIANFTITDTVKFNEYRTLFQVTIKPLMQNGNAKMRVFTTSDESMGIKEGNPAKKMVIIEFKNREIAETWYHSDEYQATIQARIDSTTDSWLTLTDQFVPAQMD